MEPSSNELCYKNGIKLYHSWPSFPYIQYTYKEDKVEEYNEVLQASYGAGTHNWPSQSLRDYKVSS